MTDTSTARRAEVPARRRVVVAPPVIPASTAFRAGVAVVTVATLVFRWVTTSAWTYFQDDWVFIASADSQSMFDFVRQTNNDHLMPIGSFLIWVTTALDPLDYTWVALSTCVFSLAVMVGWALAFRELFGERVHLVGALVVIGFAPSILPIGIWWCAALIYIPLQASLGFAVYFLARYLQRDEQRRDKILLTVSVLVGLLFWQKAVLVAVPLAFVALIVGDGSLKDRARRGVAALWPSAALITVYLVYYLGVPHQELDTFSIDFPVARTPHQIGEFYNLVTSHLVLPSMLGGPFGEMSQVLEPYRPADPVLGTSLLVLATAAIVLALVFRRRAWLIVLMPATYVFGAYGLVLFSSRYDDIGLPSVWENRYLADLPPVLMLGMLLLLTPLRTQSTDDVLTMSLPPRARFAAKLAVGGYLALAAALAVGISIRNWHATEPNSPRPWVDNLVADATAAGSANVYDTVAPDYVINPIFMFDRSNLSDLLQPLDLPLTYNEPAGSILAPNEDGRLVEAEVSSPAAGSVDGPVADCGYLVEPGKAVTIPLSGEVYDYEWGVQLDYFSSADLDLTVTTGETETTVPIAATAPGTVARRVFVVVDGFKDIRVLSSGDGSFCVTQVAVGALLPTDRRPASLG